ncbi:PilZ domain-containing protein [Massilia sp. S19_KUP03_FR1]|uniref:PilZ domain-containing protein n=1 Tax=Massilia sp. S19_KUP03_FR1 TaxID=3025503 RepID=UPI002FCD94D9
MSKQQFVHLSESDLKVGTKLPWAIYLRSGELLAPTGFPIADEEVRRRLMLAVPVRAATTSDNRRDIVLAEGGAESEPEAHNPDPLKHLRHNTEGVILTFQLPNDFEPRKVNVEYFGRIPMQSVIVSAPPLGSGAQGWNNFEGMPVTVQIILGRSICLFKTTVLRYSPLPSAHLFLRSPQDAVTKSFRQALRVDAHIPASITMPDGYTVPALITDLSGGGCALASGFILGQAGTRLKMAFRVKLSDKLRVITVPCTIRSIKGKLSQQMRYGIEFDEEVDEPTVLALKSFVYEHLAER